MELIPWSTPVSTSEFGKVLGFHEGSVASLSAERLVEAGQNYGGTLLAIELTLRDGSTLHLVGKFMPPSANLKKLVGSATTFLKEVNVYRLINEELLKLQHEICVSKKEVCDPLPRYYGSRINAVADDSREADDNAVLFLQNLTVDGYRMGDRMTGLDLVHAKMVIRKLARFQATAIALRTLKTEVFKKVIDGKCSNDSVGPGIFFDAFVAHIASFREFAPYYERIKVASERFNVTIFRKLLSEVVEPYASLSHNDLWINNIMFRYESPHSNDPVDVKFFDFQALTYSSLARDIILFLYSSLELALIENCVDELIALYYDDFVRWLRKLGCSTEEFSEAEFRKEIDRVAPTEVMHVLVILNVVCADPHEKADAFNSDNKNTPFVLSEMYRKRLHVILHDFVKRGWL